MRCKNHTFFRAIARRQYCDVERAANDMLTMPCHYVEADISSNGAIN